MFKSVIYALTILLTGTTVMAQTSSCVNDACTVANNVYKNCLLSYYADFKTCLCTKKFLNNYDRCLHGTICAWEETTSVQYCPLIYCPGKFDGGFDANAFCGVAVSSTASQPATRETYTPTTTYPIETGPA
ncbi:hypothetical protein CPB86DRAFT_781280 [Serendipita vermifera]|nr:hypothetical protein CPB86DRAFT_781280 [Serendipita vermifera]